MSRIGPYCVSDFPTFNQSEITGTKKFEFLPYFKDTDVKALVLFKDAKNGVEIDGINSGELTSANSNYSWNVCIDLNDCYTFWIEDTYGDGICCQHGNGSFSVSYNGAILGSGTSFQNSATIDNIFCSNKRSDRKFNLTNIFNSNSIRSSRSFQDSSKWSFLRIFNINSHYG